MRETFDFQSRMYPIFDKMKSAFGNGHDVFSYVMCEYSHAMGNSCGDLRFYDEIIQSDPRYAGGFIWEWCDHALRQTDENGVSYLAYGGDFGDKHHFRNICMDGTVTPDREPHSNLLEAKAVFAPLRVTWDGKDMLTFHNRNFFTDLNAYQMEWSLVWENEEKAKGVLPLDCRPQKSLSVTLPIDLSEVGCDAVLYVKAFAKDSAEWAEQGHVIGAFSFAIPAAKEPAKAACGNAPEITETQNAFVVSGKGFSYRFRKDDGVLDQMTVEGKDLLAVPQKWTCFRAPTDNDNACTTRNNILVHWQNTTGFGNIEYTWLSVRNFTCRIEENAAVLSGTFVLSVPGRKHISKGALEYRILGDGTLRISQNAEIAKDLPYWLPRYGYILSFAKPLQAIEYFGYGPAETYEDKRTHALLGRYSYLQDDPAGAYEKPQESGSHCNTKWLEAMTGEASLRIAGDFSFCASRYDLHDVTAARHRKDLALLEGSELYLDYRMSGVGSSSVCGQHPVPECRINPGEQIDFSVEICPILKQ